MRVKAVIDRFEGDQAVLLLSSGGSAVWPKSALPPGATEGTALVVAVMTDKDETELKREMAKDILNEIINTDKDQSV